MKKKKNSYISLLSNIESSSAKICGFLKNSKLIKKTNKSYHDYDKCLLLRKQKVEAYERGKWRFKSKMRNETRIETIPLRNLTVKLKYILGHGLSILLFSLKLT